MKVEQRNDTMRRNRERIANEKGGIDKRMKMPEGAADFSYTNDEVLRRMRSNADTIQVCSISVVPYSQHAPRHSMWRVPGDFASFERAGFNFANTNDSMNAQVAAGQGGASSSTDSRVDSTLPQQAEDSLVTAAAQMYAAADLEHRESITGNPEATSPWPVAGTLMIVEPPYMKTWCGQSALPHDFTAAFQEASQHLLGE